ncbi:MAG: helix-turn-helix domain-containing protein [Mangrovibacterium sp.]|nr:helix-turn-helix domain-containing protein [Mangrovibacterium sp.]
MRFYYFRPSEILARHIRYYWVLEADAHEKEVCERVIPTGNIQFMFHYGNPFIIKNDIRPFRQPRSFVSGISSHYADVATCGESGVIAVAFYPHGACHFLNFPLMEIENVSMDMSALFSRQTREIEERLYTAPSLKDRVRIIEQFLLNRYHPVRENDLLMIKKGFELIHKSRGQIHVSRLSDELFVTGKSLERKFTALVGKTPKQFIRIVRFQEVIRSMSSPRCTNLTQLAYENGYFDQAHFVKDFKDLSGYTPKEFAALGPCNADYFE